MDNNDHGRRRLEQNRPVSPVSSHSLKTHDISPVLKAVHQELCRHELSPRLNEAGNEIQMDCRYFPPEQAHYHNDDGEARPRVTFTCKAPDLICVATSVIDVRDACNKKAIAAAIPYIEKNLACTALAYHSGHGCVVPCIFLPSGDVTTDPSRVLEAICWLLTDLHQLMPSLKSLIRTGEVDFAEPPFAIPRGGRDEALSYVESLVSRAKTETDHYANRQERDMERRFRRFVRKHSVDSGFAKRVLGKLGNSPRVLLALLYQDHVAGIFAQTDFRAHAGNLKKLDRLLREERRNA